MLFVDVVVVVDVIISAIVIVNAIVSVTHDSHVIQHPQFEFNSGKRI